MKKLANIWIKRPNQALWTNVEERDDEFLICHSHDTGILHSMSNTAIDNY